VEEEEQHHPAPGHAPSKHSEEEGRDGGSACASGSGSGSCMLCSPSMEKVSSSRGFGGVEVCQAACVRVLRPGAEKRQKAK
jgi:hypothetical protein